MRKRKFLLFFSFFLIIWFNFYIHLLSQENPSQQEILPQIVKKVEPSIVMVLTYDNEEKLTGRGSGFFIGKNGEIITNRHVLYGAYRAEIKTSDGKVYPITHIIAEDKEGDLIKAKVDISENFITPLTISPSIPQVGERIIVIGNPLGLEKTVTEGIVSAVREIEGFGRIIQISAPISPGSSGSPVINMKGEVIGVTTFQIEEGQNLNFAMPSERIKKLQSKKEKTFTEWSKELVSDWLLSPEGLYYTGLTCLWDKDYEKALAYFEKGVKKDPKNANFYFLIGYCKGELGRYNEAIEAYKQAIRINPDDAVAFYNLGITYFKLGRHNEAIEAYKQAIRIKPDYAEAHCNLGVAYGKLGRHNEAIEAYKQAIRISPDNAVAFYNLGVTYGEVGRHNEAIEAYKQAIRINPDYANAFYNLGVTYFKLGRYNEAIEAYKQAIRINPDDAKTHYILGLCYLILGYKASAFEEYKILKTLDKELADELFNLIYP